MSEYGSRKAQLRRVTEIYDDLAPMWDRQAGFAEKLLVGHAIRTQLGAQLKGRVLEIGTGTGATIPYVTFGHGKVDRFIGTDVSQGMLQQVQRRDLPIELVRMGADSLAFPDRTFDVVTCSLVLCTVPDPTAALLEMSRVCRTDGRVVVLEHVLARNPVLAWLQRKLTSNQERRLGCHLDRETGKLLRDLGFAIESERSRLFGIFVLITARPVAGASSEA